ncbi:MAG: hypothetical protein NC913_09150, partial [Candidatus Omnitrophica bacterium]|nr:hypothetical protein [Candidatus Omnitrophota bacterium]
SSQINLTHTNGYILWRNNLIPTMGNNASMSAGIAIVHKNHDLTDALRTAMKAQKEAKEILGRNAFVVKVIKGSGNIVSYGEKWKINDKRSIENITKILNNVKNSRDGEGISMSFFQSVFDDLNKLKHENVDMIKSILKLKLKRHSSMKDKEKKKEFIKERENLFSFVVENSKNLEALSSFFLLLRFLATGGKR